MKYLEKLSNSWLSAVSLCLLLVFTGFLLGVGWSDSTLLDVLDKMGSFFSGLGTIAAILVARTTYDSWRQQRFHDIHVERLYEVHDSLLGIRNYIDKITDLNEPVANSIFGLYQVIKIGDSFTEIVKSNSFLTENFNHIEEKIYRLEFHKDREHIQKSYDMLRHYLIEVETKVIYAAAEYLGDIDGETREILNNISDEDYSNLECDAKFLSRLKSEVGVEVLMCANSLSL